jgi:hypothetical protein
MRATALELWYELLFRAEYRSADGVDYVGAHRQYGCTPSTCSVMRHAKHKKINVSLKHAMDVGAPFHKVRSRNTALWNWVGQQTFNEMPKW